MTGSRGAGQVLDSTHTRWETSPEGCWEGRRGAQPTNKHKAEKDLWGASPGLRPKGSRPAQHWSPELRVP